MEIEKVMEVQPVHTEHKEYASKGAANTGIGFFTEERLVLDIEDLEKIKAMILE